MSDVLTADAVLTGPAPKVEPVEVPEWGGTVHVRCLSAYDRLRMSDAAGAVGDGATAGLQQVAALAAWALSTPEGGPLFPDPGEAAGRLVHRDPAALTRIAKAAARVNGLGPAEGASGN